MNLAESARVFRSRRVRFFAYMRRHAISRVCALTFIALILTPFTAPFPSYHLTGTSHGEQPFDALPKDLKTKIGSNDDLGLPSDLTSTSSLALNIVVVRLETHSTPFQHHLPQHQVLRV